MSSLSGGRGPSRERGKDPLETQLDRENELSQTNRGVGELCVGVVPRVHSKLSRPPGAPWEEVLARSPTFGKCGNEDSYGKVKGSGGEGRHDICRMPGIFARRHDGGPPVEGDLRQESGVTWRGRTC